MGLKNLKKIVKNYLATFTILFLCIWCLLNFTKCCNVLGKYFLPIHKLCCLLALRDWSLFINPRVPGNTCALYLSEVKICEYNLWSNLFSPHLFYETPLSIGFSSSRFSLSALSLLTQRMPFKKLKNQR